jgi:flagellar operon protein
MTKPLPIQPHGPLGSTQPVTGKPKTGGVAPAAGTSFSETLANAQSVKFSNHAQKRLEHRNITLSDDGLSRLADAVNKAEQRGGRESLVLMDELAFIVNVKDRLVVTALETGGSSEGVFTQIDTVVLANAATTKPDGPSGSQKPEA